MGRLREIENFPGYWVTTAGRIWSDKSNRYLKGFLDDWGYIKVGLYRNDKRHIFRLHRLILSAYYGPCPDGYVCRHLDGNPVNNTVDNLRWGTPKENSQDSLRHDTHNGKLNEQQKRDICSLWATGRFTQREIGDKFGVTSSNVCYLVNRGN